ncbi:16S rRNA (guanine(966)-N(2))-methyltransferase RsmD [Myxococcota bacterium]|nr:16S rRNA (guanine(966)-N(2))-methyltransferase RsmD [Myxococcota bacterium]MBU1537789.1 16S rRNA (guanine(966)-N(2))-methyltransferase RsmD [Myxococcota bacterium]
MLTITGGKYVRRKIESPRGNTVRPTPSMVRGAVFDVAAHLMGEPFAAFLDCFAGSGIMGIEALSRGAESVVFVENFRSACQVIEKNLDSVMEAPQAVLLKKDARKALPFLAKEGMEFDGIYMDPPYREVAMRDEMIERIAALHLLRAGGVLMVEYQTRFASPPQVVPGLSLLSSRKWGETMVNFYGNEDSGVPGIL